MTNDPRVTADPVERVVREHGDLIYDLCVAVLWSPSNAQMAFRAILRTIRKGAARNTYDTYHRAWILRVTCDRLRSLAHRHARRLSPSEQIMLDASMDADGRLSQLDSYFHRLPTEAQIILLLRDRYGLSYSEIASAMGVPEGSLKITRQQSLRTLEEWIWNPG